MSANKFKPTYVFLAPWAIRPGTGVNAVVLGLAEAMRETYRPVIVVTGWSTPEPGQIWLKMAYPSLPWRNVGAFLARLLPNLIRLRALARDAVALNAHYVGLQLLPLVLLRKLGMCRRLILSIHGADLDEATRATGIGAALYKCLFSGADVVVACSENLASKCRALSRGANVVSVWNGIPWPGPVSPERPMKPRYLVCVAGFNRKKAHDVLLPAFSKLRSDYPDLHLVLIGNDAPQRREIADLISELELQDRVSIMLDLKPADVLWWVRHAEGFVLASREEPFGIALLEAAAVHTPVVATRVGGIPEFLTHGVHGLLCEPDNPDQLASAMREMLENPQEAQKRATVFQERAREFTWLRAFRSYQSNADLR